MTEIAFVVEKAGIPSPVVTAVLDLLNQGATLPFIARYRKDATQNADEVAIDAISNFAKQFRELEKRKKTVFQALDKQGINDPKLREAMQNADSLVVLEDLYLPYKQKQQTRAAKARAAGLQGLADAIFQQKSVDLEVYASQFLNVTIVNEDLALQGALDIVAEQLSEIPAVRTSVRNTMRKQTLMQTKVHPSCTEEQKAKYAQYIDKQESLSRVPPHRFLAIQRAENENVLKLRYEVDDDYLEQLIIRNASFRKQPDSYLQTAVSDSLKRLIKPSILNDVLQEVKEKSDRASIVVFAANLKQLLLAPPLGAKRIMGIDPGFKSGCKIVCLNEYGSLMHNETIYPHDGGSAETMAIKKIGSLVQSHKIEAIAIGDGTASRETERFIKKVPFHSDVQVFVVSEAGASVYSASKIARDEFPNYDVTVRGAVSIGRRLADPLAELVKIEPKAIGVGQYQHDVDQNLLKEELDKTVMLAVNAVGVDLNTAGKSILKYVSGIGEKLAEEIVKFREANGGFTNRKQLLEVPGLGQKTFEQAAAFLRITNGSNLLDNSAVHPEAYAVVEKMAKVLGITVGELIGNKTEIAKIAPSDFVTEKVGVLVLKDILKELEKPARDPRKKAQVLEFDSTIKTIDDLREGMELPGIINNITAFGCFVNIGIKQSGLIHISNLGQGFVSDVSSVVKLHQHVRVRVLSVALQTGRIQLALLK
ncbi:Tex family protein [Flavobacterium aurantiibacter]|uniref:RNA-binding transcriptional accessory protein n=1 Tax=Flavobacterium aurantiibacter TaxID=2023067 RepID=A0A255ZJ29_9FLAO|nr:Tex family protein [Flavobacterium aurantiibacter]OYQ41543.1 RNA-binding transcriptional accessory protein [Flavobacterium aurantiibacter]